MVERFIIGLIGAPFGLKGFIKIYPSSGEIEHLLRLKSVIINNDGKEQLYQIEESAPAGTAKPPAVLMRFAGIDTPEKAKTLTGAQLLADREQAAPLGKDEYYIEDLKGQAVFASDGNGADAGIIGHITDIIEGGGGDLAEIRLKNGELKLIPFRKEFFTEINPEKGKITLANLWILE